MKKNILSLIAVFCFVEIYFSQPNIVASAPIANYYSQSIPAGGSIYQNYSRGCFLITANELAALLSSSITAFGFSFEKGTGDISVNGNISIYLQNTSDINYTKNSTYTNVISGMTNIYTGNMTIPAPTNSTNIIFNLASGFSYTGGGLYIAWDWVSTSTASSGDAWYYTNQSTINTGAYVSQIYNNSLSTLALSNRRPVCIFGAVNSATNEAEVIVIDAPGKVAEAMHTDHIITADIMNKSINALTNLNVSLNVNGANPFTDTQVISTLAPGASTTVSFNSFLPTQLGTNFISVFIPTDQNSTNNQLFWTQEVTCDVAGNSPPINYSQGFGSGNYGTLCLSRFNFNAASTIAAVSIAISTDYTNNVLLYGVLMDNNNAIIATTNTMNLSSALFNSFQTFTFTSEQPLNANQDYYIGLAETKGYAMGFIQKTVPANRFFYADVDGSNLTASNDWGYFGIEPVITGPDITIAQSSTVMCLGESMVLSANGASSYTWSSSVFNPIDDPYNSNITVTPTSNEIYGLYGEDDQGCSNSTSTPLAVKTCAGIADYTEKQNVKVYPNPTVNGKTSISGLNGLTTLTVYNIIGELVFTKQSSDETVTIDLSSQPAGTYLLKITDSNKGFKMVKLVNQD